MKNAHRLSLMVLTVLTAAFLVVDLPLMAQMGGQQQGRGQQGAPQQKGAQQSAPQQKGAQQGAPKGAGTAQIDKSSPKLSPQQQQRVGQLRQQAQSLFRNLQQVLDQLQGLRVTTNTDKSSPPLQQGERRGDQIPPVDLSIPENQGAKQGTQGLLVDATNGSKITDVGPVTNPNPRGPQQRPGQQRAGNSNSLAQSNQAPALALSQSFERLKNQAQQIVNNFVNIGEELNTLGFTKIRINRSDFSGEAKALQQVLQTMSNLLPDTTIEALQQMGQELEKFGVVWPEY